jgi:hypothetical protein
VELRDGSGEEGKGKESGDCCLWKAGKGTDAAFAAMPADVQAKIRAGQVAVGFTPQQVELAKGKPDRVGKRTTAKGEEQSWIYEKRASGLGFGIGVGGGSGGMGGGVGLSTGGRGPEVAYVVNFSGGVVSSVEDYGAR